MKPQSQQQARTVGSKGKAVRRGPSLSMIDRAEEDVDLDAVSTCATAPSSPGSAGIPSPNPSARSGNLVVVDRDDGSVAVERRGIKRTQTEELMERGMLVNIYFI